MKIDTALHVFPDMSHYEVSTPVSGQLKPHVLAGPIG